MTAAAATALAFALAGIGYAARWLTTDGALAAGAVGTAVFVGSGVPGASILALFFISGSVLTAVNTRGKPGGARRNARQVLANGTWAAVGSLFLLRESSIGWSILVGSLAAAQSDTWATETGFWSPSAPRMITTWVKVEPGTSGGITALGTAGGVAGAVILSGVAWGAGVPSRIALASAVAGTLGMLADSALGATLQHRLKWMDNDVVNFLGSATGAGAALIVAAWR